jgi:hypothetical protein
LQQAAICEGARALVQGDDSEEVEQHDPLAGGHGDSFRAATNVFK